MRPSGEIEALVLANEQTFDSFHQRVIADTEGLVSGGDQNDRNSLLPEAAKIMQDVRL